MKRRNQIKSNACHRLSDNSISLINSSIQSKNNFEFALKVCNFRPLFSTISAGVIWFFKWAIPCLFFFIFVFSTCTVYRKCMFSMRIADGQIRVLWWQVQPCVQSYKTVYACKLPLYSRNIGNFQSPINRQIQSHCKLCIYLCNFF